MIQILGSANGPRGHVLVATDGEVSASGLLDVLLGLVGGKGGGGPSTAQGVCPAERLDELLEGARWLLTRIDWRETHRGG